MNYLVGEDTYSFDYQDVKREYTRLCLLTDDQFMKDLPAALHFAVFVCWVKGLSAAWVLRDDGIIHQLVHLLHLPDEPIITCQLQQIRQLFTEQLELK